MEAGTLLGVEGAAAGGQPQPQRRPEVAGTEDEAGGRLVAAGVVPTEEAVAAAVELDEHRLAELARTRPAVMDDDGGRDAVDAPARPAEAKAPVHLFRVHEEPL